MKTEDQVRQELHDEMTRKLVELIQDLDEAHMREPIKKQDALCAAIENMRENISLLEKRMKGNL